MAQRKVTGGDILLFIDPAGGTTYSTVICLTSQTLGISTNIIDARTKCGPDQQPGGQTQNLSFEGQMMIDPDALMISAAGIFTLAQDKTTIGWKLGKLTPATDDVTYTGTGFLASFEQTFPLEDNATFTGEIGIYGDVTQTIAA